VAAPGIQHVEGIGEAVVSSAIRAKWLQSKGWRVICGTGEAPGILHRHSGWWWSSR
jgi:hypothetical protein